MSEARTKWNARWRSKACGSEEADSWLVDALPSLPRGRALDIACGQGRNALFLAEHGFTVTAIDISEEGLQQLNDEARRRKLLIETQRADLETSSLLPGDSFDVVIEFFYLHRPMLPSLREAVRPGGVAVLRTFSNAGLFGNSQVNPDFVLQPGELLEIFAGWEILRHEEGLEPSRKGGSVAGIVARRSL